MASDNDTTIIIKKIKKTSGGHHGGAWKVAYADFVTAMMAFFLLLWLLNSASEEALTGIADFFTPTIGVKDSMGIGTTGGKTPVTEGIQKSEWSNNEIIYGAPSSGAIIDVPKSNEDITKIQEAKNFSGFAENLDKALHENPELRQFKENVLIEQTPEGLKISIKDSENRPMFKPGTAELQEHTKLILGKIVELVKHIPNYISVEGHTIAGLVTKPGYGKWELSAERANSARIFMGEKGLDPEHIFRVVGKADRESLDPQDPNSPENMRIALILLRDAIVPYQKRSFPSDN